MNKNYILKRLHYMNIYPFCKKEPKLSLAFHPNHGLDMMRVRKHIDRANIGNTIRLCCSNNPQIPHESGRITRYIDNFFCPKFQNMWYRRWMKSITRWIHHNSICLLSLLPQVRSKILDLCIYKTHIRHAISLGIFRAILARRSHEFNRINRMKVL